MERQCNKCNETKPLELFVQNKTSKGGYRRQCIECYNAKMNEYRALNPDVFKRNNERIKLKRKQIREANKEWERKELDSWKEFKPFNLPPEKFEDLTGITMEGFLDYIEEQWDEGMTWNNIEETWRIDRIKRISLNLKTLKGFKEFNHYTNFRVFKKGERMG